MFGELPKLLGRNFAIGFFLPAALLLVGLVLVLQAHGVKIDVDLMTKEWPELGAVVFATWLCAIMLMALNRPLVRLFEGYSRFPGREFWSVYQKRRFLERIAPILQLDRDMIDAIATGAPRPDLPEGFDAALRDAVSSYPPTEAMVLPSRFGNVMRAFETYSWVVYRLDAIPAWARLQMVLPQSVREQVQDGRALLDFSVNLVFAGGSVAAVYLALAAVHAALPQPWLVAGALIFLGLGWQLMPVAARQWGEQVKSAFDLYRGDLARQLGLSLPLKNDDERKMWAAFNRTAIYRSRQSAADLLRFRSGGSAAPKGRPGKPSADD